MAGIVQVGKKASEDLEQGKLLSGKQANCNAEQENKIKEAIPRALRCLASVFSNCGQKICEFCACWCEGGSTNGDTLFSYRQESYRNAIMMYAFAASQSGENHHK
jgi:hypothetical protein